MKREFKIESKEVALEEYERFCDSMRIYIDLDELDAEELSGHKKIQGKIIRAIMYGDLIFNEEGEAVYTPFESKYTDPITFRRRDGAGLMATDNKKKGHDVAKMYAVMGAMCKLPQSIFASLYGDDIKVTESIFALLMD